MGRADLLEEAIEAEKAQATADARAAAAGAASLLRAAKTEKVPGKGRSIAPLVHHNVVTYDDVA